MLTRLHLIRLSAGILLSGALVFSNGLATVGRAQEARKGAPVARAQAANTTLLSPELLTPCTRLIPSRTQVYGTFAPNQARCLYVFPGASGEVITIRVSALDGVAPPTMRLLAPRGAELVTGTAATGTVGSLIYGYRLRESGLHTVLVETDDGNNLHPFRLALAGNTRCGGRISPETVIAAQLSAQARYCVYSFTGQAGSWWQLTTHKLDGGAAPEVDIFDPQGLSVVQLQTSNVEPIQTYQLPADGVYTVLVNAVGMADVGSFELALLPATEPDANAATSSRFAPGVEVRNVYLLGDNRVNLRRTPGHVSKTANDVLLNVPGDATMLILGPAVTKDRLPWWPVRYTAADNTTYTGWVAEITERGYTILAANE